MKIRGFRIELGEIEARLAACPGVREAVVIARPDSAGEPRLIAYWLAAEGAAPEAADLRDGLLQHLADYMVPAAFVQLEAFPLTANGKLDRKALPAIEIGGQHQQDYLAPRNELEQTLADIWVEVLKVERVGVQDNFFELGGHSLLATQIASRVQKRLQLNVPLRAMFECSTVEALAQYVEGVRDSALDEAKVDRLSDLMAMLEGA